MMKSFCILLSLLYFFAGSTQVYGTCETACSDIADDETAFNRISENINAIEYELGLILESQADPITNMNVISQSVSRKMQYSNTIREILTDYFLYQKIQPLHQTRGSEYESYSRKLALFHNLLNASIQAKDSTDTALIQTMRTSLDEFKNYYYGKSDFQLGQHISQTSLVQVSHQDGS